MPHLQKLFGKLLVAYSARFLDAKLPETQWGFRRGRQPAELLHVISKIIALRTEWAEHVTLTKLDLKKAFDSETKTLHFVNARSELFRKFLGRLRMILCY